MGMTASTSPPEDDLNWSRKRRADNEAAFQKINQQLKESALKTFADPDQRISKLEFFCECSDRECLAPLMATIDSFESISKHPRRFLVLPGHEQADIEDVLERNTDYWVVEKKPDLNPSV